MEKAGESEKKRKLFFKLERVNKSSKKKRALVVMITFETN